jgi:hypothetical protein
MTDKPNPAYFRARFKSEVPAAGLPRRFGIVTAYNPYARNQKPELNELADAALRQYLEEHRLPHFRATGGSIDRHHTEPGFAIEVEDPNDIRAISRLFHQDAFYWVDEGTVFVANTEGATFHLVGAWQDRQLPTF